MAVMHISSIRSNAGDNTICPSGTVDITGVGLTAGNMYVTSDLGMVEVTGLTWTGTRIYGNPAWFPTLGTVGSPGQLIVVNSLGETAIHEVTIFSTSAPEALHGFFNGNIVTTTGTQYAPRYNYPNYGSYGKIVTFNWGGPMGVTFAEFFQNPDGTTDVQWSAEVSVPLNQLARIGEPVKAMFKSMGLWDILYESGGGSY